MTTTLTGGPAPIEVVAQAVLHVDDRSPAVTLMWPDWALAAALLGGTRAMRAAGQTYLPKWPKEADDAYALRLACAVLFPAYQRTVQTLAAKPFSKPIALGDDIPQPILDLLPNIDLQGRNLDTFAADILECAIGYGLGGILVESPQRPVGVRTQADEQRVGLRPYWIQVKPQQVLGWRAARVNGVWALRQLRLHEITEEPDGAFGVVAVEQVRVLEPGKWTVYRSNAKGQWSLHEEGVTTLGYIPFVPVYGGRTGFMTATPPLIEVAHLNVAHWQSASDQQTILHVARVPILTVTGVEDEKWTMTVGSSAAIKLPADSKMAYVEHSGAAIGAGVTELEKIEERMRQAGAELLVMAPGRITATQIQTENAVGMCVLQRITQSFEDALDSALQMTADWMRLGTGGHVTLFNDYGVATLQEASAQLLLATNQAGKLSDETLHAEYQRRGILSADQSWEDEQARLDAQGPALGAMTATPPVPGTALTVTAPEITPVTPIPNVAPPEDDDESEPAMDMQGFVTALAAAIGGIQFPAPVINVTAEAPQITVESPTINVNVPEQPAPIVNVAPAAITVESPTINMPEIVLPPAPPITVHASPVNVTIEKSGSVRFTEDDAGNITGAELQ